MSGTCKSSHPTKATRRSKRSVRQVTVSRASEKVIPKTVNAIIADQRLRNCQQKSPRSTDGKIVRTGATTRNPKRHDPSSSSRTVLPFEVEVVGNVGIDRTVAARLHSIRAMGTGRMGPKAAPLASSYMATTQGESDKDDGIEMDFLRIVGIDVFGTFFRCWSDVSFLQAGDRKTSRPLRVLLDTGHSLFWINRDQYMRACKDSAILCGERLGLSVSFYYGAMSENIIGDLFEGDIAIGDTIIERQIFAVVDETNQPRVKKWREEENIIGVLGIGPESATKGLVADRPEMTISSVGDALLKKGSARIIAMNVEIPDDGVSKGIPPAEPPVVRGELHFGGFKRRIFRPKEPIWVAPSDNKVARNYVFSVDIKILCDETILVDRYPAVADMGCPFIIVPFKVLKEYRREVQRDHGRSKIFHWDSAVSAFYVSSNNLDKLKDVRIQLGEEDSASNLLLPKSAQVIPSSVFKKWDSKAKDGCWYVVFRGVDYSGIRVILLGLYWIRNYYVIKDESDPEKKQIAAVEKKRT